MKLKNILLVVNDIEKSKQFYRELFGMYVVRDFGENVILSDGLVLQEKKVWEDLIENKVRAYANNAELYFENDNMEDFLRKLEKSSFEIDYLNRLKEHSWGQRVVRIYDPDKHIIEIGESLDYVVKRLLLEGMTEMEISDKTGLPIQEVELLNNN